MMVAVVSPGRDACSDGSVWRLEATDRPGSLSLVAAQGRIDVATGFFVIVSAAASIAVPP